MLVKELLTHLELGSSVAEHEKALENYFLKTDIFNSLINDKMDFIAGDKGTGKSAIYKYIEKNYRQIPELQNVAIISAINPTGNPIFKNVTEKDNIDEDLFRSLWKWYIFSLVGNWFLETYKEDTKNKNVQTLTSMLSHLELRTADYTPKTVFEKILGVFRKFIPKEVKLPIDFQGVITVSPEIKFGDESVDNKKGIISADDALEFLNKSVSDAGFTTWVLIDRLDEAFQSFSSIGYIAIRSLFRTYLDFLAFDHIKLKLFVGNDLFRKVTTGGFINLTHINARKRIIIWNDADLLEMLCKRIRSSQEFIEKASLSKYSNEDLFNALFPSQVDKGKNKSKTWNWMLLRIRDGNNVKAPRNLIGLVNYALTEQIHKEERESRECTIGIPLFEPEAIRTAHDTLSKDRVDDTLLAEAGEFTTLIERFRNGKSEHNAISLSRIIGQPIDEARIIIDFLVDIGFLGQVGSNYKIPVLYRNGLNITQGKAF